MECLEEIKKLNIRNISEKTHISILEIKAILNKDFSRFNHTKAVGFTKIFKREYNIDLTQWLEEYEQEIGVNGQKDGIFLVSKEKEKGSFKKRLIYIFVGIVAIIFGILLFSTLTSTQTAKKDPTIENKEIIEEAKKQVQENKILEEEQKPIVEEDTFIESNSSKEEVLEEKVEEERAEKQTPQKQEVLPEKEAEEEKVVEPTKPIKVFIYSRQNLWIGVKNHTNNTYTSKIFKGEFTLDPDSHYTLTFGHGYFDLVSGENTTKSRLAGVLKYEFKDGVFKKKKYIPPKQKQESVVVPLSKEVKEVN